MATCIVNREDDDLLEENAVSSLGQGNTDSETLLGSPKKSLLTGKLLFSISACVIGTSFNFGYNTGVVNAPQLVLEEFLNETHAKKTGGDPFSASEITLMWSIIVAIFCLGGMIGGISAGVVADFFGRKKAILLNSILSFIGAGLMLGSKYAPSYEMLIIGRLLMGINAGLNTGLAPMYLSEIAPVKLRGASGSVNQLTITIAVLVSQVLGLEVCLGTHDRWPFLLGLSGLMSLIQVVIFPFCPESPRYLMLMKHDEYMARKALTELRGTPDVDMEIIEMKAEQELARLEPKFAMCDLFRVSHLRTPAILSIVMQIAQQLSGINAVIYYSTSIFRDSGLTPDHASYATLGVGGVIVFVTVISVLLIDLAGRRLLILASLGGMWIFITILTITFSFKDSYSWLSYISIVSVMAFVGFFSIGLGSIPWFIVAELFTQGPRGAAMSIAVLINWLCQIIIALGFPQMQFNMGKYTFIPFVVLNAMFWLYMFFQLPETKNKTIEQISMSFRKRHSRSKRGDDASRGMVGDT
ncbi:solute carrier family 2, facilitated glucose transporter member 3-like isoform X2 [Tubulanus polymorphus]|uniref:solute carrier family 2, facilitated glucose transporter member 3-like isoform X2 n=1 Tax=Tubulanus polymorphus TaxID=672921 RepID=UPI003DA3E24F